MQMRIFMTTVTPQDLGSQGIKKSKENENRFSQLLLSEEELPKGEKKQQESHLSTHSSCCL